jgi:hypothetical protein
LSIIANGDRIYDHMRGTLSDKPLPADYLSTPAAGRKQKVTHIVEITA